MSTASAVLRQVLIVSIFFFFFGTYVYRFGGIETSRVKEDGPTGCGTYVYRFGGIET